MKRRGAATIPLSALILLLLCVGLAFSQTITDPNTDPRVREVARDLQCPVCQNVSVADSPSGLARDMRSVIAKQLDEGRTREEIERYFVERYGEGILLRPSSSGFTGIVWLGPWIVLALGLVLIFATLRFRRGVKAVASAPSAKVGAASPELDRYEQQLETELQRYRERVG